MAAAAILKNREIAIS